MAKYNGVYSCGHEGVTNIIGPQKDRGWKIDNEFSKLCPKCYREKMEKEREIANKEAEQKTKEWELPELKGSEKQVAWGNTLRIEFADKFNEAFNKIKDNKLGELRYDLKEEGIKREAFVQFAQKQSEILDFIYKNKVEAKYYIDNRVIGTRFLINIYREIQEEEEKENMKDIIDEATIAPSKVKHAGVVEIKYNEEKVEVIYEKNEEFITVVRKLGYKWHGKWEKELRETTGSYIDRVAELGNNLLNSGFSILIYDEEIREKAINADYEVECKRWIHKRKDEKKLALKWTDRSDLYSNAKKIKGAIWENPCMIVDISHFEEIEEFARIYGFEFTREAWEFIKKYKDELKEIKKVNEKEVKKYIEKDGLKDILNSSTEIVGDLLDD